MRVFAGPNGSGKSTVFEMVSRSFDLGTYINPDLIERALKVSGHYSLETSDCATTEIEFSSFLSNHSLNKKARSIGLQLSMSVNDNVISCPREEVSSYHASCIADFLRTKLISAGKKLTFETVMSHPSKLEILDFALSRQFKNYLYFVCTSSPDINITRVKQRVALGGHSVPENLITERYFKSLGQLKSAVKRTHRAFIWDNSGKKPVLIAEVTNGKEILIHHSEIPAWADQYLLS